MLFNFLNKKLKKFNKKNNSEIYPEDIFLDSSNLSSLNVEKLEGSISKPILSNYSNFIFILLIIVLFVFSIKLYNMSIINYSYFKEKSDNNKQNFNIIFAARGQIFDRNGNILAFNQISSSSPILRREYIKDEGFSNVLGYISYPKLDKTGNFWQEDYLGKDGVELYYNDLLNGKNGKKIIEKDVSLNIEIDNIISPAINGNDLYITLDKDLQKEMFNSIKNVVDKEDYISGVGILMNIKNGEIIAMVNYPEYNNNILTNPKNEEDSKKIADFLTNKKTPFLNRAIQGLFVPGSVVKPFMGYAAIKEGVISPEKQILSTGALIIKNPYGGPDSVFKDWKKHGYVDIVRAIAQSSDEYFYQVGGGYKNQKGIGIEKINEYAKMFGLASTTGIDLLNENIGIIPNPEWKRINFIEGEWNLGNTYHTSIGQYGFQVTPIALIKYISAIGNGGYLVTPHLYLNSSSTLLQNKIWPITNLNLDQNILSYIKEGIKQAVQTGGTVYGLNIPELKIAGKTGTAELGIKKLRVNSLIVGYFPYDNPKYSFVFILENGPIKNYSGSIQAAIQFFTYFKNYKKDEYLK